MGIFYQIFNFVTMSVRIGDEKISLACVHSSISSSDHSLALRCITMEYCLISFTAGVEKRTIVAIFYLNDFAIFSICQFNYPNTYSFPPCSECQVHQLIEPLYHTS